MDKLTLVLIVIIAVAYVVGMVLDDTIIILTAIGYSIIWAAFYLGEKLDDSP